jgi:hypothetical protein
VEVRVTRELGQLCRGLLGPSWLVSQRQDSPHHPDLIPSVQELLLQATDDELQHLGTSLLTDRDRLVPSGYGEAIGKADGCEPVMAA